ncbi:N-acetylgalactosaminyltransferase 7-like [Convolutriloba macropyga]|uniref:N-acetylgalactosaminyltransferase 7-like n=1 Tax=Convolutriloba macropyga TaxID=536237 RepID=UPI003F526251
MRLKLKTWIKFCAIFGFCLLIVHYFVIGPDNRVPDEPEGNPKIRRENGDSGPTGKSDAKSVIHPPIMKSSIGNFEPPKSDRSGPGEFGKPVYADKSEKEEEQKVLRENGFNMFVSDRISYDRAPKDMREEECKYWHYPTTLPNASVIVVFHNEPLGTVIRTVHSVVNTIPKEYLAEVVLLDDASSRANLGAPLEDHMSKTYGDLVKIVRSKNKGGRQGLIRARIMGAEAATRGQVLIFLDAHCEANPNWYAPLVTPIALNKKAVTVPLVDVIDAMSFEMRPQSREHAQGGFDWDFNYKRYDVPKSEQHKHKYQSEPYWSPVMAGGLFAADKDFFWSLGGYDRGLEIWGAEQYEISFKAWMCGGEVLFVPCSRVGHIYRTYVPGYRAYDPAPGPTAPGTEGASWGDLNHMRVAEVWMDEYKEDFYISRPNLVGKNFGDVSEMKKIREQCNADKTRNSFKWFMENVAYDLPKYYPRPHKNVIWGELRNQGKGVCLDRMGVPYGNEIGASGCHGFSSNQAWRVTEGKELRFNEHCTNARGETLINVFCHGAKDYFIWEYDKDTLQLKNVKGNTCVELLSTQTSKVKLRACDANNPYQQWKVKPTI